MTEFKPLVSIIIPVFNVERYIERCIQSVMDQVNCDFGIECILVNDFTPDNSIDIISNSLERYSGPIAFRIVEHEQNLGLSEARNTGIKNAKGSYCLFLDSDDYLFPNSISTLVNATTLHPGVEVVLANNFCEKIDSEYLKGNHLPSHTEDPTLIKKLYFRHYIPETAWNILIQRQTIIDHHLFFIPKLIHEDLQWTYRLYTHIHSFCFQSCITYTYTYNSGSIMNAFRNYNVLLECYLSIIQDFNTHISKDAYIDNLLFNTYVIMRALDIVRNQHVSKDVLNRVKKERNEMFIKSIKECHFFLVMYQLLLFRPFDLVFRISFIRHNLSKVEKIISKMAS